MHRLFHAIATFWEHLADVRLAPLAIAVACHLVKLGCTSRAWRNVLAAAYPEQRIRWRSIYGAYVAGVGVNAVFPARAGDVMRLYLTRRAIPTSSYTTLISSTLVLTIVDSACAVGLFTWALTQGVLPSLDVLPSLPSLDFHWLLKHGTVLQIVLVLVVLGAISLAVWVRTGWRDLKARVAQAFTILRTPTRYLRSVAAWQACDWALRLATIWFFLGAFHIHQSLRNVLLVQATSSLATLVPISPGGIGTEQALLLYTLRGQATRTALLAFSVGMKITLTVLNAAVGFSSILLTLRTVRFRRATEAVNSERGRPA